MRSLSLVAAGVAVALCAARGAIVHADATAPKLETVDRPVSTPPASPPDAAEPLPRTVTICQDSSTLRCWSEAGETDCASEVAPSAKVFRRTGSAADPGDALADCWAALHR